MYVNREAALALESPSVHDSRPTATTVRYTGPGKRERGGNFTDGVEGRRREPKHGRRRPTTGVTTPEHQRHVRQEKAATRHSHSRAAAIRQRRPSDNFFVALSTRLDGDTCRRQYNNSFVHQLRQTLTTQRQHTRTAVRQLVRLSNSSVTLRRTQHSDSFNIDYCDFCRSPREQLSYSSSVPLTLCLGDSNQPSHRLL